MEICILAADELITEMCKQTAGHIEFVRMSQYFYTYHVVDTHNKWICFTWIAHHEVCNCRSWYVDEQSNCSGGQVSTECCCH